MTDPFVPPDPSEPSQPAAPPPPWAQPAAPPAAGWQQPAPGPWQQPPPQGWPPAPQWNPHYGWAPAPRTTNGLAIAALVTGIVVLGPVAIGLGIAALVQINRRQQAGTGLAVAGLVLGCLWTIVLLLGVLGFLLASSDDSLGDVADAPSTTYGACVIESPRKVVDCTVPHDAEVYFTPSVIAFGDYPGKDGLADEADNQCFDAFEGYVGESYEDSAYDYGYFTPSREEWVAGERRVICVILPFDEDELAGSVRGSGD